MVESKKEKLAMRLRLKLEALREIIRERVFWLFMYNLFILAMNCTSHVRKLHALFDLNGLDLREVA